MNKKEDKKIESELEDNNLVKSDLINIGKRGIELGMYLAAIEGDPKAINKDNTIKQEFISALVVGVHEICQEYGVEISDVYAAVLKDHDAGQAAFQSRVERNKIRSEKVR